MGNRTIPKGSHDHGPGLSYEEALEQAREFRRVRPQPPAATRVVDDYLKAPPGFEQFPPPPNWPALDKARRRRR